MSEGKRKIYTCAQKAKVALEAVKGTKTVNEIAQEFGVHPSQSESMENSIVCQCGQFI